MGGVLPQLLLRLLGRAKGAATWGAHAARHAWPSGEREALEERKAGVAGATKGEGAAAKRAEEGVAREAAGVLLVLLRLGRAALWWPRPRLRRLLSVRTVAVARFLSIV